MVKRREEALLVLVDRVEHEELPQRLTKDGAHEVGDAREEWSRSHQRCEARRRAMLRILAGVHIAGVRRRFLILASIELELDVGAVLTLAGGPEHRLGIVVELVPLQTASRVGRGA